MNIVVDVVKELFGMFLADARLTTATLALVAIVAILVRGLQVNLNPLWGRRGASCRLSHDPGRGGLSRSKTPDHLRPTLTSIAFVKTAPTRLSLNDDIESGQTLRIKKGRWTLSRHRPLTLNYARKDYSAAASSVSRAVSFHSVR